MFELDKLKQRAIDLAIEANWPEAIKLNKKIIELDDQNLEAWLRLGFSYLQNGELSQAEKSYQTALKIQPANQIARDNLRKIHVIIKDSYSNKKKVAVNSTRYDPQLFLKEPGKTKIISLVELGQKTVFAKLGIGEEVFLKLKKRKIIIKNGQNEYIGCLPDDLSRRLILFIKAQSVYRIFVKEATVNKVVVLIKEIKKGRRVSRYISFPENIATNMKKIEQKTETEKIDKEKDEEDKLELELIAEHLKEDDDDHFSFLENELDNGEDDDE